MLARGKATGSMNTITEITRRAVADWFTVTNTPWWGRLDEASFVGRIFDLSRLPSNDYRCSDMGGDISMHRDHWTDWENDWVFFDSRLNLLHGPDEKFVAFLCEVVHPVVRPDAAEAETIVKAINDHLRPDGWQIAVGSHSSGRPVHVPQQASRPVIFDEPTGWGKVDRQMAKVKTALAAARTGPTHTEQMHGVRDLLLSEAVIKGDRGLPDPRVIDSTGERIRVMGLSSVLPSRCSRPQFPSPASQRWRSLTRSTAKQAVDLPQRSGTRPVAPFRFVLLERFDEAQRGGDGRAR